MVTIAAVSRVLGLRRPVTTLTELRQIIERGLPKGSLTQVVRYVLADAAEASRLRDRVIPPATFKRRSATLKPEEGERVERLARVMALAEDAFGSQDDARVFLTTPHPELQDERPLDVAHTELGARQVEEVLWRMEYGLPA